MKKNKKNKKRNWKRIGLIVLCSFLALVLVSGIGVTAFIEHLLNRIQRLPADDPTGSGTLLSTYPSFDPDSTDPILYPDQTLDPSLTATDPSVNLSSSSDLIISHEQIVNIMLVGMDRRAGESYNTRSDAMILCTFNLNDNSLTMTSFLRDTYVAIPGASPQKLNAAYAIGGSKLLSQTLYNNFGVVIDGFFTTDFTSFEKVVDALGGVDVVLTQAEVNYLSSNYGYSLSVGSNHLSGIQALNYCRIRYIGTDWERTNRQRKVLSSIISAYKNLNLVQATSLLYEILPLLSTDLTNSQITSYITQLFPVLTSGKISTQTVPCDGSWYYAQIGVWDCIVVDLDTNRQFLYDTLMP